MDLILDIVAAQVPLKRIIAVPIEVKCVLMELAIHAASLAVGSTKLAIFFTCWAPVLANWKIATLLLRDYVRTKHCGLRNWCMDHKGPFRL